jgi:predicted methyltransferase
VTLRLLAAAALALASPLALAAASSPVTAALADPARPAEDRARDSARRPADLLALAGVKPRMKVADFIMGGGYWTRILAKTVGDTGKVYAYQPKQFIEFKADYGTQQDAVAKAYANVVASRESLGEIAFPEPLDAIITVQNWHDLHLKMSPPGFAGTVAKKLYASLKPGGVLLVVDHVGPAAATPFASADSLHRGDAAATRAEIEAAGFKLAKQSPLYANPADPHTALVFAPAIRGKTDQFVMVFRKAK